jgi:translocation and assembly module TamB
MRALAGWLALALLVLAPAWVLGTGSGLQFVLAVAAALADGRLTVEQADGRLLGDVTVRGFAFRADAATVSLARADVNLRLSRLLIGRIQAERLDAQSLVVALHERAAPAVPSPPRAPLTVSTPLRLAVEEGRLADFRLRRADGREWVLPEARFGAHWRDEWIVIGLLRATTVEAGAVELRGRIAIVEDRLRLVDVDVAGPGTLHAEGAVALGDADSKLEVTWRDLRSPRADLVPWLTSSHGELTLEGPWRGYAWKLAGHVHAADVAGDLAARGRGTLRDLHVQRAELRALDGSLVADGRIAWSGALRTEAALQFEQLNPGAVFAQWPGRLTGQARLDAQWREGAPRLEFDGALRESELRGYPLALQATGRTEGGQVLVKELALESGASRLRAQGRLLPDMDLRGELRSTDLRSLWAGLAGQAALSAGARGTFDAPRLALRGTLDHIVYGAYRAAHVAVDAQFAPQGHSQVGVTLSGVDAGVPLREVRLAAEGTRRANRLRIEAHGAEGAATVVLAGGVAGERWQGRVTGLDVAPPRGAPWTLEEPAALLLERQRVKLEPACLQGGASRACAEFETSPAGQRVAFRARQFELQHLRAWLPGEWNLTGTLSGTAALRMRGGELAEIRADLAGSAGAVEGGGVRLDYGPGEFRVQPDDGRLHATLRLRPAGGEVDGDIWIAPGGALLDRPMLGDLRVRLPDLAWLPVLSPEIAAAQGSIDGDLHVSGSLRGPALHGRLQVANGRVTLTTPGIELTDIAASFERGRDAPLNVSVSALSGGGRLALAGQLKSMQPRLVGQFTLKGENVQGFNTAEMRAWMSPDLTLALDGTTARLTGEVGVPRAEITPRELGGRGVAPSGDQVILRETAEAETAGIAVESEVRVVLGDAVSIDGLGLKTKLTGAIVTFDEPGRPTRGRGELRLVGGRYKAYGQELQIEEGRLIFTGGPVTTPAIDIRAIRKPREDIKVGLRARGTLERPEFSLFSEPAMSQEEQLSWLVLGRSLSGTLDSSQRTQLSSAALSLGLTGGEYLAQQLAPRLGLDVVSLGAKPGETADLARFTIGKYLSPKLFVSYGVGLFQPGHFFRLQYDLGKRFKLVGESGVQQGGDVLYSIER